MEEKIFLTIWELLQFGAIVTAVVTGVLAILSFLFAVVTHTAEGRDFNAGVGLRFTSISLLALLVSGALTSVDPRTFPILLLVALLATRLSVKLMLGRWTVVSFSED